MMDSMSPYLGNESRRLRYPPLVNAALSDIKYLVDGSLKREDSLLINVARKNWLVVNTAEVKIPLVSHKNVFDTV